MFAENRKTLTTMRKARSTERTRIDRLSVGTQVSVLALEVSSPLEALYTSDFSILTRSSPPFLVNMRGVVMEVGDETTTQQSGKPMRGFRQHDQWGPLGPMLRFGAAFG